MSCFRPSPACCRSPPARLIRDGVNSPRVRPHALSRRVLLSFDAVAEEPVWRRALVTYVFASACLWMIAGLVHHEYGVASWPAFALPVVVVANAVVSVVREVLITPLYFAALAGILLAVSRLTPGKSVSFRQLFSVTVHAGYILLAGHALRIVLAAGGVDPAGAAAALLPDPDAMFLGDTTPALLDPPPLGVVVHATAIPLSTFPRSPADIPAVGVFDAAFHALLGVAYCRLRGDKRLIVGAAWGCGLSLLVDVLWLLLGIGRLAI